LTANDQASGPIKQFQNTLQSVKGEMGGVNSAAGTLAGGLAGLAAAAGIGAIAELGEQMMDLGRQAEQAGLVRDSFDQLATGVGQSSQEMLQAMRQASSGMIADTDLVLSANRAMMLGVADSSQEMAQLLEVAAVRGRAMGMSTADAFNDLVTGLGRMSPMILDNLGIVTGGEKVFTDYAASVGKAADALTDAEKKQALLNKVISETDTSGEIVVSQFERMDAAISNAKIALGELFSPAVAAIAQQLADAATDITDRLSSDGVNATRAAWADVSLELENARDRLQDLQQLQGQLKNVEPAFLPPDLQVIDPTDLNAQIAAQQGLVAALREQADAARQAYMAAAGLKEITAMTKEQAQQAAWGWDKFSRAEWDAANAGKYLAEAERLVAQSAGLMEGSISRAGSAVDSIRGKFVQAAAAGMSASLAFSEFSKFKGLEDQAKQIQSGLANLGFYDSEEIAFYVDLNTQNALTSADEMITAFNEMNTAAAGAAGGGVSQLDNALSGLQGRALSAVQDATKLDVGLDPEDFLPREDAVNENARRLASIMRDGFADQSWLEEFKQEVPNIFNELASSGDVQGSAARMLQDFQAGLRPELLDIGAIKEKIKNELAGEAAMQATAGQIAADLVADTGGDAADIQSKVNKALGLGVDSTAITDSIFGQLTGATFTGKVTTAATGAGKQWGETFLGMVGANVPAELVLLLTNLVTPQVRAQLLLEQSQTTPPAQ
jgi:hypothetical protein